MNNQEMAMFNRITGFGVFKVEIVNGARRDPEQGTEVLVYTVEHPDGADFFFPDYAGLTDDEMTDVVLNWLKAELWNSLKE